jgi:hypothetical protein
VPLKVGEIIKVIETDGWYLIATRESRRQYKHPDKPGRRGQGAQDGAELHGGGAVRRASQAGVGAAAGEGVPGAASAIQPRSRESRVVA